MPPERRDRLALVGQRLALNGQMKRLTGKETRQKLRALGLLSAQRESFGLRDVARKMRYDWHSHPRHQLLYAFKGTVRLESAESVFVLPPQRAAWIPAGIKHATTIENFDCGSIFLAPAMVHNAGERVRVIGASPLLREMIRTATRWPAEHTTADPLANSFFETVALLCEEWIEAELPFYLPRPKSRMATRAAEYTMAHLDAARFDEAARHAHASERTLRRHFEEELGISWSKYLHQARMLRAMELLAQPDATVTEVAYNVGFRSLSAFSKAYREFSGDLPGKRKMPGET